MKHKVLPFSCEAIVFCHGPNTHSIRGEPDGDAPDDTSEIASNWVAENKDKPGNLSLFKLMTFPAEGSVWYKTAAME